MLVSFEQVAKLLPTVAAPIDQVINMALGPITGGGSRSTLYDPNWGYFLFGQSLRMEYQNSRTYMDKGEFTIEGEFTINAENAIAQNVVTNDDSTFLRIVAKYEALESMFTNAGFALAPNDYSKWGTSSDARCIALPSPLVDANSNVIYAIPQSLDIQQTLWGNYIHYRAVLTEAKFPPAKVVLNGVVFDEGTISITCPQPIMSRVPLIGCAGELVQVDNYSMAEFELTGSISGIHASGHTLTDYARTLLATTMADYIDIGVVQFTTPTTLTTQYPFGLLSLDDGCNAEVDYADQVVRVSIKAKADTF